VNAGSLNLRVTFKRRAPAGAINTVRGGFTALGDPVWADYRDVPSKVASVAGADLPIKSGLLTIRSSSWAYGLTNSDRVEIDGTDFAIENIKLGERVGFLELFVTGAMNDAVYAREFENGEVVTVRRLVPNAAPVEASARAKIKGYEPAELTGGIQQGDRKILLSHEDLVRDGFPVPVKTNDKIILLRFGGNRVLNVQDVDDSTHRDAGDLAAYLIRASG
jgi:hypothetical protein